MRALLDTDVILDIFLVRNPFVVAAAEIWKANEQGHFDAFVSGITPVNAFSFMRKVADTAAARQAVRTLLDAGEICPINVAILEAAWISSLADYEDAVQHASAVAAGVEVIVTCNLGNYRNATLPVLSPADFLAQLPDG